MKEQIIDFSLAALPWIAAGLLLAILCVRGAGMHRWMVRRAQCSAVCLSPGMCCARLAAASVGHLPGIGLSLGMLLGLAVGSSIKKEKHGEKHEKKS